MTRIATPATEPEQLCLFPFDFETAEEPVTTTTTVIVPVSSKESPSSSVPAAEPAPAVSATPVTPSPAPKPATVKPKKPSAPKVEMPSFLKTLSYSSLADLAADWGLDGVMNEDHYLGTSITTIDGDKLILKTGAVAGRYITVKNESPAWSVLLAYVDENAHCWHSRLTFSLVGSRFPSSGTSWAHPIYQATVKEVKMGKWLPAKMPAQEVTFLQSIVEIDEILSRVNPYGFQFMKDSGVSRGIFTACPWVEILSKAGYEFVENLKSGKISPSEAEAISRLCQNGTSPKTIFKTSKVVYTALKNEENVLLWDIYRKMDKFGRIDADAIQMAYDMRLNVKDLELANSVLNKESCGRKVFTWSTLVSYLRKVDQFEAISTEEALQLLADYLRMCGQLKMKPCVDGDSLKREHDVCARLVRMKYDEDLDKAMKVTCDDVRKYNYSEGVFSVRAIYDLNDLLDEANQQHSCVASYGKMIADRTSLVFVMRENANPDKSLITIELSPDGKCIRQKRLAFNKAIRNRAQTEFIERWEKFLKTVK